jgi:hypothetical protein
MRQGKFKDAQQVLKYASELYSKQGNGPWAQKASQQLQKAQAGQSQ